MARIFMGWIVNNHIARRYKKGIVWATIGLAYSR